MFGIVGANLSERVSRLFFHAVLYMEVAWFDQDANTSGNLTSRLAADAPAIRGAVGDSAGIVVQNVVTLLTGYTIAFVSGWKMALVITAVLPLLAFSSYMQIKFFTGAAHRCPTNSPRLSMNFCTPIWVCTLNAQGTHARSNAGHPQVALFCLSRYLR